MGQRAGRAESYMGCHSQESPRGAKHPDGGASDSLSFHSDTPPPGSSASLYTTQTSPTWAAWPVRSCLGGPGACLSSDTSSPP